MSDTTAPRRPAMKILRFILMAVLCYLFGMLLDIDPSHIAAWAALAAFLDREAP